MHCKQFVSLSVASLMLAAVLTGCGGASSTASSAVSSEAASAVSAAPSPAGNNRRTHLQLHRTGETHSHTERNVRRTGTDEFRHADALLYRLLYDQKRQLSYG